MKDVSCVFRPNFGPEIEKPAVRAQGGSLRERATEYATTTTTVALPQ